MPKGKIKFMIAVIIPAVPKATLTGINHAAMAAKANATVPETRLPFASPSLPKTYLFKTQLTTENMIMKYKNLKKPTCTR